jgi:hypothetical protein
MGTMDLAMGNRMIGLRDPLGVPGSAQGEFKFVLLLLLTIVHLAGM